MTPGSFTDEDRQKVHSFVNLVSKDMRLSHEWDTKKALEYIRLLGWMQRDLMDKIAANVLEVNKLIEPPKEKESDG